MSRQSKHSRKSASTPFQFQFGGSVGAIVRVGWSILIFQPSSDAEYYPFPITWKLKPWIFGIKIKRSIVRPIALKLHKNWAKVKTREMGVTSKPKDINKQLCQCQTTSSNLQKITTEWPRTCHKCVIDIERWRIYSSLATGVINVTADTSVVKCTWLSRDIILRFSRKRARDWEHD